MLARLGGRLTGDAIGIGISLIVMPSGEFPDWIGPGPPGICQVITGCGKPEAVHKIIALLGRVTLNGFVMAVILTSTG